MKTPWLLFSLSKSHRTKCSVVRDNDVRTKHRTDYRIVVMPEMRVRHDRPSDFSERTALPASVFSGRGVRE